MWLRSDPGGRSAAQIGSPCDKKGGSTDGTSLLKPPPHDPLRLPLNVCRPECTLGRGWGCGGYPLSLDLTVEGGWGLD